MIPVRGKRRLISQGRDEISKEWSALILYGNRPGGDFWEKGVLVGVISGGRMG